MDEPSVNIEKCLLYYLQRHFALGRRLLTISLGDCPYDGLLGRESNFLGHSVLGKTFSGSPQLADLIYLGGGHDFFELSSAVQSAQNCLAPGGILVLPHLGIPTTNFLYNYLKSGDNFALHFTMENTAFFSYSAALASLGKDWTNANLNRQEFPAFDHSRYAVLPDIPIRRSYEGFASACGKELERGFMARSGRILSEGHRSRITFRVAPKPGALLDIAVEVRGCAPNLPRPVTVSLSLTSGSSDARVLTDDSLVVLRATGELSPDGLVSLDLAFSDVFSAHEVARSGFDMPTFGRLAVELVSISVKEAAGPNPIRTIRHHDGRVASVFHEGHEFHFFVDNPHDSIQAHHLVGEFYELEELRLIGLHIGEGARILDIGANIGNHTVYFEKVMKASRVVVIELQERVIELLKLNLSLNNLMRTDISRLGIGFGGSNYGAGILIPQAFNPAGAQFHAEEEGAYTIRRGDDVLDGEVFDLVKIDVEGMECDVIEGLGATIQRSRPKLFVEVWQQNIQRFNDQMAMLGYRKADEWRRYDVATNLLMEPNDVG